MSKKDNKKEKVSNEAIFSPDEEKIKKKSKKHSEHEKTETTQKNDNNKSKDDNKLSNEDIKSLHDKINEYEDIIKRQQAEFDNYRKRTIREKEEISKYSSFSIIKDLLSVKDNLERAIEVDTKNTKLEIFIEGFEMIVTQFNDLFKQYDVEENAFIGMEFDPNKHQSIACETDENIETDIVAEVFQKGYSMYDRTLRVAQVKIKQAANN